MNHFRLGQCLGTVSPEALRRHHNESLIDSLAHQKDISFSYVKQDHTSLAGGAQFSQPDRVAHQAGVNCLAIDNNDGQYLFSGGADSTVRLWDLEDFQAPSSESGSYQSSRTRLYSPKATLSRSTPSSHTHALTSISIYPFDPTPSTLLTTSYDKTLKVTSISPTALTPIHTFQLDHAPYTHSVSPLPDSSPLIAVGTAHPSIRLLDLRSGLSTHSMSGPNGAIYSLAWSPRHSHLLASGSADGRVLFFDIRRANAAFASLDHDDAVGVIGIPPSLGVIGIPPSLGHQARQELLDFNAQAHNGAVTAVTWLAHGDKVVTAGHDQRIRVWDTATGRNELVHFGPRIRNERLGELKPLISPAGTHLPGRESLFWPNDDGRGMIFQHHLREGHMLRILRTEGIKLAQVQAQAQTSSRSQRGGRGGGARSGPGLGSASSDVGRLTSGGRINVMVWRVNSLSGEGVEMYTAHGDGRIGAWLPAVVPEEEDDEAVSSSEQVAGTSTGRNAAEAMPTTEEDEVENRRKRKRALIGDLVEGLAKRPLTFS